LSPKYSNDAKPAVSVAPSPSPDYTDQIGSGKLGDFFVKINGYEMDQTWQDEPCIIVSFEWTNNSAETTNFMAEMETKAFQNGIECEAEFMTDSLSESDYLTDVKPGYSLVAKCAYVLRDKTNPIDVEVTKYSGYHQKPYMVKQSFEIKD
jgi:hypothetical protein